MRVPFGRYAPDLPPLLNPGLTRAANVFPGPAGYLPVPSLVPIFAAGAGAAADRVRGAMSGITPEGTAFHVCGDATKLYRMGVAGLEDVSRASVPYHAGGKLRWVFTRFNNALFASSGADALQYAIVGHQAGFSDLVDGDNPVPRPHVMGVVGSFLVVGDYYDTMDGPMPSGIRWSAAGNPLAWPIPQSDAARAVDSDKNAMDPVGGNVMAIVGGEVGTVFQERAISRMDFAGGDVVFNIRTVEATRGLLVQNLAIPYSSNAVLYLAEDGWYVWDYAASLPVGYGLVDRTFLADIQSSYFDRVSWAIHPSLPMCLIAYPGQGSINGTPNKVLAFNYATRQWSHPELELEILTQVIRPTPTIDTLPADSIDGIVDSLDEHLSGYGSMELGAYTTGHELAAFSGAALAAEVDTGDVELNPGRRSVTRRIRPIASGAEAPTLRIADMTNRSARNLESPPFGRERPLEADGKFATRVNARYHRFRLTLPEGFTDLVGLDVEAGDGGAR